MFNQKKGYRLHLERIIYSGGEITRSIKYLLASYSDSQKNKELLNNFSQDLYNDDLKIRGCLNLNDLVNNNQIYNLADFWIDSLRAGVIWQSSASSLIDLIKRLNHQETIGEKIFNNANERIKRFFNSEKFIKEIILSEPKRISSKKQAFYNSLFDILKDEFKKQEKNEKIIIDNKAEQLIKEIVDAFYSNDGVFLMEGEEKQNNFWQEKFNIDKNMIKKEKEDILKDVGDITAFIHPPLIILKGDFSQLIDERKKYFSEKDLEEILGLSDNFNAFSHYFNKFFLLLYQDKQEKIFECYQKIFSFSQEDRKRIKDALDFLSEKSKLLGLPKIVNSWSDYRSVFGGKIKSWFSNYLNREDKAKKQEKKIKEGLEKVNKFLLDFIQKNQVDSDLQQEIKFYYDKLNQFINSYQNQEFFHQQELFLLFSDLLAEYREKLNRFYQKYLSDKEKEEKKVDEFPLFKDLFEKYEGPISFYGKTKLEDNKKIIDLTFKTIKVGLNLIRRLLIDLYNSSDFKNSDNNNQERDLRRIFEFLLNKIPATKTFREKYLSILKDNFDQQTYKEMTLKPSRYTFVENIYSRENRKLIELPSKNFEELLSKIIKDLTDFSLSFKNDDLFVDIYLLSDLVELAKTLISLVINYSNKSQFDSYKNELIDDTYQKAKKYLETFKISFFNSKKEANYFYQTRVLSELKGAVALFSKKYYQAKYNIQILKSNEIFPLFVKFSDLLKKEEINDINKLKLIFKKPYRYLIALKKIKFKKKQQQSSVIHLDKKNKDLVLISPQDEDFLFKLTSSFYQLQFLDRFVYPVKKWLDVDITLSEWSFILEKKYKINWDFNNGKPEFSEIDSRLYLNIPFKIKAINQQKILKPKELFLGIDVGEYGVGYALVNFKDEEIKIIKSGFIRSKNIASIRDKYRLLQDRSKKGVYFSSTNVVQEVRENAIGEIRNQIHDILIKNNADLIYEYNISNFETGSGRITKIYDSIKKSDVYAENEADKSVIQHVWGIKKSIASHLSAYGSSYTCSNCGRSIFSFSENDICSSKVIKRDGNIITIQTPKGEVFAYSKDKKFNIGYSFSQEKNKEEMKNLFMKIVKAYARPPLLKSEVLLTQKKLDREFLEKFKKERGNSAIFVCPFVDCQSLADSDIQAAFIMALRGYLKKKKGKDINYLEESLNYLQNFKGKINFSNLLH